MVEPFRTAFADHAGPFLLQFPPAGAGRRDRPAAFAAKLGRFLAALPRDFRYAVELRDPALLTGEYRAALADAGAGHVYNYATAMPMPQAQAAAVPIETASFAVIRLLLAPGTRYNDRREEFEPFDRIVAPDLEMRRQVVSLARQASSLGRDVFVLVNNKAEGCSPLTIRALAEMLAEGMDPRSEEHDRRPAVGVGAVGAALAPPASVVVCRALSRAGTSPPYGARSPTRS